MSSRISTFFLSQENVENDFDFLIDVDNFLKEEKDFENSIQEIFEKSLLKPRQEIVDRIFEQIKK